MAKPNCKHEKKTPLDVTLRDVGVRMLKCTLSLSLAASLVPVVPTTTLAESGVEEGEAVTESTDTQKMQMGGASQIDNSDSVTLSDDVAEDGEETQKVEEVEGSAEAVDAGKAAAGMLGSSEGEGGGGQLRAGDPDALAVPQVSARWMRSADENDYEDLNKDAGNVLSNRDKLVIKVTDEQSDLDLDQTKSYVEIVHTAYGSDVSDEPLVYAFEQNGDNSKEYTLTLSSGDAGHPLQVGLNQIRVVTADTAGNVGEEWSFRADFDNQAPEVKLGEVTPADTPVSENVYRNRTMELTIADVNGVDTSSCRVLAYREGVDDPIDVTPSTWNDGKANITFGEEGTYTKLEVTCADSLGNSLASEDQAIPVNFVINHEPTVAISLPTEQGSSTYEKPKWNRGKHRYEYKKIVMATVKVDDSDFDTTASTVSDGDRGYTVSWEQQDDGSWLGTFELHAGLNKKIEVTAKDGVGEVHQEKTANIYIDMRVPEVVSAKVSRVPDRTYSPEQGDTLIYKGGSEEAGGIQPSPVAVTFDISDDSGINSVRLLPENNIPAGVSLDTSGLGEDAESGTIVVTLQEDGAKIDRAVLLEITDVSGNARIWSIDERGKVIDSHGQEIESVNTPIANPDGSTLGHPFALALDQEKPVIIVYGPEIGLITDLNQSVRVEITESNFELLKLCDPNQKVLTIERTDEQNVIHRTTKSISDLNFKPRTPGDTKHYITTIDLEQEGDYVLTAKMVDVAGYVSNGSTFNFAIDRTPPDVKITGVSNDQYSNADSLTATITVIEKHFKESHVKIDASGMTPTEACKEAGLYSLSGTIGDWKHDGNVHTVEVTFTEEGTYHLHVKAEHAGNKDKPSTDKIENITIDRTAPVIRYQWNGGDLNKDHDKVFYNADQKLRVEVVEANWNENGFDPIEFVGSGRKKSVKVTKPWTREKELDKDAKLPVYSCELDFGTDANYGNVDIDGTDLAGNASKTVSLKGFTIDKTKPTIKVERKHDIVVDTDEEGIDYYDHPITATVTIQDRNLDTDTTKITHPGGELANPLHVIAQNDDGVQTWEATIKYDEGSHTEPKVNAVDKATNADVYKEGKPFVVDLTAPVVENVTVKTEHTSVGVNDDGERRFYNKPTAVVIDVADNFRIKTGSAKLVDPQNEYTRDLTLSLDRKTGGITIDLVDGTQSSNDTEFDRYKNSTIVLTLIDVAGNERTWSIAKDGTVKDYKGSSAANTSINNKGEHPLALIEDQTNPVASLSGVEAGQYYNSDQVVTAVINEFNFQYLKDFDGDRAVMHVNKQEGNAGRAPSSWSVPASQFGGAGSGWSFVQPFDTDGHYVVWVSFADYANNPSNEPRIEEFTIDKTAPIMTVTFDNNDVRNGKYYNAYRNATIVVEEHNFDPSLFTIETNGSIGGWSSDGDTHTCVVSFGADGTYNLTVGGKDMANNEAVPFTEPEFVIDTQAPTVTIAGLGERLGMENVLKDAKMVEGEDYAEGDAYYGTLKDGEAYNGIVEPAITYEDEQNYNSSGWSFELVGNKVGNVTDDSENYSYGVTDTGNGQVITFNDFGASEVQAADGADANDSKTQVVYNVDVDDIYTIHATLRDLAENEAEADITFSVNRFGSNYLVKVLEDGTGKVYDEDEEMLSDAPRIEVREINVCGMDSDFGSHTVSKEYANSTTTIKQDGPTDTHRGEGYQLAIPAEGDEENPYGWSEYIYYIRSANFGAKDEDATRSGEGQGLYRVNVASEDAASNGNNTAEYWSSDARRSEVEAKVGTAEFVLDQLGPEIDATDLPGVFSVGDYKASFHVTDALTSQKTPNKVTVLIDGKPADDLKDKGDGTYEFTVPTKSFAWHNVSIEVEDYAGRGDVAGTKGSYVTGLVPEALLALAVLAAAGGGTYISRRRRDEAEPDMPTRRHEE